MPAFPLAATLKNRASLQASANTETRNGKVQAVYSDANGNIASADILLQGEVRALTSVPNASGLRLSVGMAVTINFRRGSRLSPQIIAVAGSAAGSVLATATAQTAQATLGTSTSSADVGSVPVLLQAPDETAPEGYIEAPGANVTFQDTAPSGGVATGSNLVNGVRTINARPLVMTGLPSASAWVAAGVSDGTLVDLIDSYGNGQGMYRLDATNQVWRRRDAALAGITVVLDDNTYTGVKVLRIHATGGVWNAATGTLEIPAGINGGTF